MQVFFFARGTRRAGSEPTSGPLKLFERLESWLAAGTCTVISSRVVAELIAEGIIARCAQHIGPCIEAQSVAAIIAIRRRCCRTRSAPGVRIKWPFSVSVLSSNVDRLAAKHSRTKSAVGEHSANTVRTRGDHFAAQTAAYNAQPNAQPPTTHHIAHRNLGGSAR